MTHLRARPAPVLAALLLVAPVIPVSAHAQHDGMRGHDHEAAIDALMAEYNRSDAPGAVVGVVHHGELIFAKAYGMASLEHGTRLTTESILDVGSVSKQFTAFAIALLAHRGVIGLDDDIRRWLPEVPDFGSTIRIRHLVHHTSGLREIYNSSSLAGYQGGDGIAQPDALRLVTRMRELNFEPNTRYLYCNTGYMLLADIVSRATGMSFADFMQENVFDPLGMRSTTIMTERGQVIPGAAESYAPADDGFRRIFDNSGIQGAGGIYTTVGDLAKWVTNYHTAQVGGPEVIAQMKERGVLANGDTLPYAFGLRVEEMRGLEMISHSGSSAGYRAAMFYFPEIDAAVVRQANRADFAARIDRQIGELHFGHHLEPAPEPPAGSGGDPDEDPPGWSPSAGELRAFTGQYWSAELETMYTLVVRDAALVAQHRRHQDFELSPGDEPDVFESGNFFGSARFERDGSGSVTGMRVSNGRVLNLLFERLAEPR